jgi:hypothetical protein
MAGTEESGKPKADLLVLDGHQIKDGKISRTNFFDFLNMDLTDYSHIQLTPEEAMSFRAHVVRMKYGMSAAIPMNCAGKSCVNKICPFHDSGKYPLTKPCLVEARLIQVLTQGYMEELNVNTDSLTEVTLINKLVECDLLDYRANLGLSGGIDEEAKTLLKENVTEGKGGVMSITTVVHPLLDIKERLQRTRASVLEAFVATRKEKVKKASMLKKDEDQDASNWLANLKKKFNTDNTQSKTSLDRIKEDAEKVAKDLVFEADWEEL